MNCLPTSLKCNETYAVFNQIRTVNADRFIALKEGGAIKECEMEKDIFHNLMFLGLREMVYGLSQDDRIKVFLKKQKIYSFYCVFKYNLLQSNQEKSEMLYLRIMGIDSQPRRIGLTALINDF